MTGCGGTGCPSQVCTLSQELPEECSQTGRGPQFTAITGRPSDVHRPKLFPGCRSSAKSEPSEVKNISLPGGRLCQSLPTEAHSTPIFHGLIEAQRSNWSGEASPPSINPLVRPALTVIVAFERSRILSSTLPRKPSLSRSDPTIGSCTSHRAL